MCVCGNGSAYAVPEYSTGSLCCKWHHPTGEQCDDFRKRGRECTCRQWRRYIPEIPSDDTNISDDADTDGAVDAAPSGGNSGKADEPDSSESTDSSLGDTPDSGTDINPITPDEEQPLPDDEQLPSDEETAQPEQPEESSDQTLYQDGKILIYTCDQLKEIGSGNTVTGEDGTDITYASDAQ